MSDPSSPQPSPEKRAALRTATPVEVVLKCPDKSGKTFIEKTRTVDISRTGAKTLTEHDVSKGARLQMAVPHRKRMSGATVARIGNKTGNLQEIGIAIDETNDLWGVRLPDEMPATDAARKGAKAGTAATEANPSLALVQELLDSTELKTEASSVTPEEEEASDQLSRSLQDQVRHSIEQSLEEALRRLNEQANEMMKNMQELITRQTEDRLRQCVEAALRQVEAAALDITNRSKPVWEQRIQGFADSAQEQLRARLTEHETQLAASAAKLRRELARKLAEAVGGE